MTHKKEKIPTWKAEQHISDTFPNADSVTTQNKVDEMLHPNINEKRK